MKDMKLLVEKLSFIQKNLKAPKNQYNKFGQYFYRNCEDIQEAIKPLLGDFALVVYDEVVMFGNRYYVKAVAELTDGENSLKGIAYAREQEEQKGMNASQITGSASSYARKYALNGLFLIDDTKDADATNTHGNDNAPEKAEHKPKPQNKQWDGFSVDEVKPPSEMMKRPTEAPTYPPQEVEGGISTAQQKKIYAVCKQVYNLQDSDIHTVLSRIIERNITHTRELTKPEASTVIDILENRTKAIIYMPKTDEQDDGIPF